MNRNHEAEPQNSPKSTRPTIEMLLYYKTELGASPLGKTVYSTYS